jgi:hypothetical protein
MKILAPAARPILARFPNITRTINCTRNRMITYTNSYYFILLDENGIFCIQSGREERWPPKFVCLYKSWHCFSVIY